MPRRGSSGSRSLAVAASFFLGAAVALVVLVALQRLRPTLRGEVPAAVAPRPTAPPEPAPTARVPTAPTPTPEPRVTPEPAEPPRWRSGVATLGEFDRRLSGSAWSLTWGFVDHHGVPRRVTCRVGQEDHAREVFGFGYEEEAVRVERDARLRQMVDGAIHERGLEAFVEASVEDGAWKARHTIPGDLGEAEQARLDREIRQLYAWLKVAFRRTWQEVTADLLAERGLRLEGDTYEVDHAGVARRASDPLADCAFALDNAADTDLRRHLGAFVAFFQEIRYERPPARWRGRQTLGFYVPTEVLVGNHGDCDSKSVAFAAMWRHRARPVLLVRVPGHMLVGVEMRPGPGERFVRLGNRYFVLCEVVGPAKRHPGSSQAAGWFRYVLIEPAGLRAGRGRSRLPEP